MTPLIAALLVLALAQSDDAHNHDGSHPDGPRDCGSNYMLPGETARLGSHSFMILGTDGFEHIIASHRSGTPPHNYQFLLRVRLDPDEMEAYARIAAESKTLPAFTTIDFDEAGKQRGRTFFCLADLPRIFGAERQKGDTFERLFPIKASLQKDADHEGTFEIEKSVVRGAYFSIDRQDVELIVYRYLPAYLPQDTLRKAIAAKETEILPLLAHAPIAADEPRETAEKRSSYMSHDGIRASAGKSCPKNFYLKKEPVPETIHSFLLLAAAGPNAVLATHYYDQAPQNFQTALKLTLSDEEMKLWRAAQEGARAPPLFQTDSTFCMENIRTLQKNGSLKLHGTLYKNSTLDAYKLGAPAGTLDVGAAKVQVLVNRRLESFMNPLAVAKDVLRTKSKPIPPKPSAEER